MEIVVNLRRIKVTKDQSYVADVSYLSFSELNSSTHCVSELTLHFHGLPIICWRNLTMTLA